ncbi:molybdenum cofactor guanylyltransferase [Saccharomonospora sp. CUA-673]|uniref:molybdenum cofactor guanylyltransferase n=1 Tax=Saccharomonospora sp. CUA-673 TaxID=1904969 RepID=UPI0035120871
MDAGGAAGGGPVAALAAGLSTVEAAVVVLLAADLPGVRPDTVARLVDQLAADPELDGAVLVDDDGRRQWLQSAWRTAAVRAALPPEPAGTALRTVLGGLRTAEVPARPGETADVDTPADL